MIAAFLISFREILEATIIVVTIAAALTATHQHKAVQTVIFASITAIISSAILLLISSLTGAWLHDIYEEKEEFIEGILLLISATFITWAVFVLHQFLSSLQKHVISSIQSSIHKMERRGLFFLVYTAIIREGIEIVLFLSTVLLANSPMAIMGGFTLGLIAALGISGGLYMATSKLPIQKALSVTNLLLILYAAGMFVHAIAELTEVNVLPQLPIITIPIFPDKTTAVGSIIKSVFGLTKQMNIFQVVVYIVYVASLTWWIFIKPVQKVKNELKVKS